MRRFNFLVYAAAVLLVAALIGAAPGVLASATEGVRLASPSPTAGVVEPHVFFGVDPVPPPMPKVVVGKRAGSLVVGKLAGGPVAKGGSR